jgi:hypothetical protein
MEANSSSSGEAARWVCVCQRHGHGKPHPVSDATYYRHLAQAETGEEQQKIRARKALTIEMANHLFSQEHAGHSGTSLPMQGSESRGIQLAKVLRGLIKRAREANPTQGSSK